jgi:hypothetical protein
MKCLVFYTRLALLPLALAGCGGGGDETPQFDPPVNPPQAAQADGGEGGEPAASQKPFKLLPVGEVLLKPGETVTVEVKVERNGQQGPIQLALEGLPGGIEAPMAEIAEGESSLKISLPVPIELGMAGADGAEPTEPAEPPEPGEATEPGTPSGNTIKLTATLNEATSEQPIKFKIAKPKPPELKAIAGFTLKPGASKEIEIKVDRRGFQGPIALAVEGLPAKVTVKSKAGDSSDETAAPSDDAAPDEPPAAADAVPDEAAAPGEPTDGGEAPAAGSAPTVEIAEGASSIKLVIAAARGAQDGQSEVKITSTVRNEKIETAFPLVIESFAVRLGSLPVVTLKPGEKKTIDVPVVRRSYQGALKLQAKNVPEKVSVAAVEIPEGADTAKLEVTAAADAPEQVRSAYLTGKGGDADLKEALIVRVCKGEAGFLPKEAAADAAMARHFRRGAFGQRTATETKQVLLKAYGGTAESEAAVLRGLKWLASQQNKEGGNWSLAGGEQSIPQGAGEAEPPTDDAAAPAQSDVAGAGSSEGMGVAGTALALLPFLGAGVTHQSAPADPAELKDYQDVVLKGLTWIGNQMQSGDAKTKGSLPGGMLAHAIGTITLCEAYGMSQDSRIKRAAEAALQYLVKSQQSDGGWRARESASSDLQTTRWAIMALRSGQLAGLSSDRTTLNKAGKFLDSCGAGPDDAKLSRYSQEPGGEATLAATAAGLLSRELLGWERDKPELAAGCQWLLQNLPSVASSETGRAALYYELNATQLFHHLENEQWDKWNHAAREHLVALQQPKGTLEGSFNPGETGIAGRGGRLDSTVLALLTLECYYRQMPLYRKTTR